MKKIFLALGAVSAVAIPVATVLSCGSTIVNNELSWTSGTKTASFNLNQTDSALKSIGLNKAGLTTLSKDFDQATTTNNAPKLKTNDVITLKMTGTFTKSLDNTASPTLKTNIVVNYVSTIKYKYSTTNSFIKKWGKENTVINTNILDSLAKGFLSYLNYTPNDEAGTEPGPATSDSLMNLWSSTTGASLSQNTKKLWSEGELSWKKIGIKKYQTPRSLELPTIIL